MFLVCTNEFIWTVLPLCLVLIYHGYTNINIDRWWVGIWHLHNQASNKSVVLLVLSFLIIIISFNDYEIQSWQKHGEHHL